MRTVFAMVLLAMSSLSVGALADDQGSNAVAAANPAPQCMPVQVNGMTSTACFGLSDDLVQNLGADTATANDSAALDRRCEDRCVRWDRFGRCDRWRRFCW
jgi:hypothetical protein